MRTKFTLLAALVVAFFSVNAQQVPNASFDSWTTDTLAPDGWGTYGSFYHFNVPLAQKDAVDKVAGPYSLKLTSDSIDNPNFLSYGVMAGMASLGKAVPGQAPKFTGIAFTSRPDSVILVYKYVPNGIDTGIMAINLNKAGSSVLGHPVYGAALLLPPTDSLWGAGSISITSAYTSANVPDTLKVAFYSSKNPGINGGVKGSVLHVDGILFAYAQLPNALQEIADKLSIRLYPNPTTDVVNISTAENAEGLRAYLFDMNGRVVAGAELSGVLNSINISSFASGTYVCRIADKDGNIVKQERFSVAK